MTSAKTGLNVDEAFLKITKKLMEKKDEEDESGSGPKKIGIRGKTLRLLAETRINKSC